MLTPLLLFQVVEQSEQPSKPETGVSETTQASSVHMRSQTSKNECVKTRLSPVSSSLALLRKTILKMDEIQLFRLR